MAEKRLAPRSIQTNISHLNKYWLPGLAHRRVRRISFAELRAIDIVTQWPSNKTHRNALSALAVLLDFAFHGDLIDHNPARKFKLPKVERKQPQAYTLPQRDSIVNWLFENTPTTPALFYATAFDTGMRSSELTALHWSRFEDHGFVVDRVIERLEKRVANGELIWDVITKDTKTHEVRYVPLSDGIYRRLIEHRAEQMKTGRQSGWVFLNQYGRRFTRTDKLNPWFKKACEAVGAPVLQGRHQPNPWRHTYFTLAYDDGLNPNTVAEIRGHSPETANKHYRAHMSRETLREEARKRR